MMKSLSIVVGAVAFFAMSSVQACPYMDKVTKNLKTYTGEEISDTQSPELPNTDKKLLVDIKKPAQEGTN